MPDAAIAPPPPPLPEPAAAAEPLTAVDPFAAVVVWVLAGVVIAVCAAVWAVIARRAARGLPPLPHRPPTKATAGLLDFFVMAVLLVGLSAASLVMRGGVDGEADPSVVRVATGTLAILLVVLSAGLMHFKGDLLARTVVTRPDPPLPWWRSRSEVVGNLGLGVLTFAALTPPVLALHAGLSVLVPYQHGVLDQVHARPGLPAFLTIVAFTAVVVPIYEEWTYRGLFQGALEQVTVWRRPWEALLIGASREATMPPATPAPDVRYSAPTPFPASATDAAAPRDRPGRGSPGRGSPGRGWIAIVVSAALFACGHLGQGAAAVPLFLFAVGLGYVTQRTGRLLPAIVAHALLNGGTLVVARLGA